MIKVGIVALQGAVSRHRGILEALGAAAVEVRSPSQLVDVDAVVVPGGESTTMGMLLDSSGLRQPLRERLADGMPAFGTCAGMIVLASEIVDGRSDQAGLGVVDISVRRNGFGRQRDSFEIELDLDGIDGGPFHAVFIRAPVVERAGPQVEILAEVDGSPVLCRQGPILVSSFHPELASDRRLHALYLDEVAQDSTRGDSTR